MRARVQIPCPKRDPGVLGAFRVLSSMIWKWKTLPDPVETATESALAGLRSEIHHAYGRLSDRIDALPTPLPPDTDTRRLAEVNEIGLAALEARMSELRTAVSVAIEHEDRREKRIRATVTRARKELEERDLVDPAIEAEYDGLSVSDGGGSEGEGLPPVHGEVAEGFADTPSSIPGVSADALRKVRGF